LLTCPFDAKTKKRQWSRQTPNPENLAHVSFHISLSLIFYHVFLTAQLTPIPFPNAADVKKQQLEVLAHSDKKDKKEKKETKTAAAENDEDGNLGHDQEDNSFETADAAAMADSKHFVGSLPSISDLVGKNTNGPEGNREGKDEPAAPSAPKKKKPSRTLPPPPDGTFSVRQRQRREKEAAAFSIRDSAEMGGAEQADVGRHGGGVAQWWWLTVVPGREEQTGKQLTGLGLRMPDPQALEYWAPVKTVKGWNAK
jgi:hypothetical protein